MSDSDIKSLPSSLPKTQKEASDGIPLSDISERDKPWDKHKYNAEKVSNYYSSSREYQSKAQRVDSCANLLDFKLVPDHDESAYKLKLSSARFCRVRHCPICQWRRSLMWKAKAAKILPKVCEDYPKSRWLFVTFTIKNCKIEDLRETLALMNKGFKRLTELKAFPAIGWLKSVEVTRNARDNSAHPHFHCLLMVKAGYFKRGYLSQQRWCELWQQSMRLDYLPICDVQAIKPTDSPTRLLVEVVKYQVKEMDLTANREWFLELNKQLHKTRAIAVGGVLKDYLKALEEEPEDLIHAEGEDTAEVDEGHLYFGWRRWERQYKLLQ